MAIPPPPPGFTLDAPQSGAIPPPPPGFTLDTQSSPPAKPFDALRQVGLVGRATGEGVINTLAAPLDFQESLIGPIRNAILQKTGIQLPDLRISSLLNQALNSAGAANPETPGEQMGSAITRGVTGALTGGALTGVSSIPNAIRTGLSGATGAGASEFVRQKGYGPGTQLAAGVIGGLAPGVIESAVRVGANALTPLTESGQQQIAGNVMATQATDRNAAAARLQNAQEVVPGSARNTGEASQDTGLLALEKGLRSRNPAAFGQRISEQNVARQNALAGLAGTPEDIQAMQGARNAETGQMRDAAMQTNQTSNIRPVLLKIDRILESPIGQRDIPSQALNWVKDKLGKVDDTSDRFLTPSQLAKQGRGTFEARNPENLYAIRQDIGDALAGKLGGDAAKFRLARKELMDIRSSLDDAIEQGAPGFKAYLARYSDLSKPIDQAQVIQEIQRRAQLTAADVTTGQNFMGSANFSRALDSALQKAGNRLTPDQVERLNAIRTDLQYGQAVNSPLVKAPGSDTFQNLSIAQAIGAGGQKIPGVAAVITKPLDWIYKLAGTDKGVNEALTRAMLDPKLAAMMLQRATPGSAAKVSAALRAYGVGATLGTASTLSRASEPQSSPAEAR